MNKVNTLLASRLKKTANTPTKKTVALAKQSIDGSLSGFAGVFRVTDLTDKEKASIKALLNNHVSEDTVSIDKDLSSLITITSEVKAINNQAAILHGERIKKAQDILKNYHDGAFTSWLLAAYGNRQTPYNFLQYYEFHCALPKKMLPQLEIIPRQAVYTLASRSGTLEKKMEIVKKYSGQTKAEFITLIRERFPLAQRDKRRSDTGKRAIDLLTTAKDLLKGKSASLSKEQKSTIKELLSTINSLVNNGQ